MSLPRSVQLRQIKQIMVGLDQIDSLLASLGEGVLMERIHAMEIRAGLARMLNHEYSLSQYVLTLASSMINEPDEEEVDLDGLFTPPAGPAAQAKRAAAITLGEQLLGMGQAEESSSDVDGSSSQKDMTLEDFERRRARVENQKAASTRKRAEISKKYPDLLQRRVNGAYWDEETRTIMCRECRGPVDSHPVDENLPPHPDGRLPLRLCDNSVVVCTRATLEPPGYAG